MSLPEPSQWIPSLADALVDPRPAFDDTIHIALPVEPDPATGGKQLALPDRRDICLSNGKAAWKWRVESLRSLFRGDRQPPDLRSMVPPYEEYIHCIEEMVLLACDFLGDRHDRTFREIYATLQRRPDGKGIDSTHDLIWQGCALTLGLYPISEAEFTAMMARLELSCRHFAIGLSSKNYIQSLRRVM